MKRRECRLILLAGKKHSGKTTFLQRISEKLKRENFKITGLLAPSVYEGAFLLGYNLVNIDNGKRVKFARRRQLEEPFQFSSKGWRFGQAILNNRKTQKSDLVIIDEFGPIELAGGGWRKDADLLLSSTNCIILLVVRKEIVSEVKRLYRKYEPAELAAKRNDSINECLQILNDRKKIKDKQMVNEEIAKRLGRFVKGGQISCKQCFKIAGESKVSLKSIGDACNKMKIKIRSCQLGCFK